MSRTLVVLAGVLVALAVGTVHATAEPDDPWPYVWPVTAPIIDNFRAPASPYAPGNRGVEFDTMPGQTVVAARSGMVTFAGPVAGRLFITVLHVDGVRTSYGAVASIGVAAGQQVATGQHVATARDRLHVSARIGNAYVDPAVLFGGHSVPARLVVATRKRGVSRFEPHVVRRGRPDTIALRRHFGAALHIHLPLVPTHGR